jgi:hypothetical protein
MDASYGAPEEGGSGGPGVMVKPESDM